MPSNVLRFAWGASKSKYLFTAAAAVMLAACSESFDRFAANPSDSDPVYTASVPKERASAPSSSASVDDEISSRPLENASVRAPATDNTYTYQKPTYKQAELTQPAPQVVRSTTPPVAPGGTVTVGPGMTLYSIARANNLSVAQLASVNRIRPPYSVRTGQVLRIPGASDPVTPEVTARQASVAPVRTTAPVTTTAPAMPAKSPGLHTVSSGETLFSLGRKYNMSPYAIADANGLSHNTQLSLGQSVKIPGGRSANTTTLAQNQTAAPQRLKEQSRVETPDMPAADETTSVPQVKDVAAAEQAPEDSGVTGMRWPVRGKVISAFGPKSNGLKNEGINIAVPEGTSVRAAGSGVVAYAGNELKGYGNLVLIRHEQGYVTAYAHAKELFVKRGDTVKRGDVIAKAGRTGSVSSPQLHFEVRKGATALDPIKYLSSSTASN